MSSLPTGIDSNPILPSNAVPTNSTSQTLPSTSSMTPSSALNISPVTLPAPDSVSRPVTPRNKSSINPGNVSQQILATYILLSPASKSSLDVLLDKERANSSLSHWSNVPRPLPFDLDENAPVLTPDATMLPVSNLIGNLADSGFHVPLSLFLHSSLYKLQNQSQAVKTVKVHHKGQKVYVLDTSQFPSETEMLPVDWYCAWNRLLEWIGTREGPIKKRMWACHYRFLSRKENFVENFPVILRFDIEIRSFCASDPDFSMSMEQYKSRFLQLQICHLQSVAAFDRFADKSSSWSRRFSPYGRKARCDTPDAAFRKNQRHSSICLTLPAPAK